MWTPFVRPAALRLMGRHLRMFINDLGMAGGGHRTANAIRWHAAAGGSAQREAGRQRTRRLVDIHINGELGLCSAAMRPS